MMGPLYKLRIHDHYGQLRNSLERKVLIYYTEEVDGFTLSDDAVILPSLRQVWNLITNNGSHKHVPRLVHVIIDIPGDDGPRSVTLDEIAPVVLDPEQMETRLPTSFNEWCQRAAVVLAPSTGIPKMHIIAAKDIMSIGFRVLN